MVCLALGGLALGGLALCVHSFARWCLQFRRSLGPYCRPRRLGCRCRRLGCRCRCPRRFWLSVARPSRNFCPARSRRPCPWKQFFLSQKFHIRRVLPHQELHNKSYHRQLISAPISALSACCGMMLVWTAARIFPEFWVCNHKEPGQMHPYYKLPCFGKPEPWSLGTYLSGGGSAIIEVEAAIEVDGMPEGGGPKQYRMASRGGYRSRGHARRGEAQNNTGGRR